MVTVLQQRRSQQMKMQVTLVGVILFHPTPHKLTSTPYIKLLLMHLFSSYQLTKLETISFLYGVHFWFSFCLPFCTPNFARCIFSIGCSFQFMNILCFIHFFCPFFPALLTQFSLLDFCVQRENIYISPNKTKI